MAEGEGNVEGNVTGNVTGNVQTQTPPAWVAQLPENLKANEVFTKYPTIGDLGKSHLEVMGKIKELDGVTAKVGELEGKLSNSIPKLPENPTKEQTEAFYAALGRPAKAEEYEFPKGENVVHDENMIKWARDVFFNAGLSKNQAALISQNWDGFVQGMVQAEEEAFNKEIEGKNQAFRSLFKSDEEHNAALEGVSRYWKKVISTFTQNEEDVDINKYILKQGIGKDPTFLRFVIHQAKLAGEDFSPQSSKTGGGGTVKAGMVYDRTPQHQK